jgi:uncharacterized protein YjdB
MTSCGDKDDESVALTGITVTPTSLSLVVDGQQQIVASAVPKEATGVSFVWSSSNDNIATVNQSGIVVAKSVGTATITVQSGSIQATVQVSVSIEEIPLIDVTVNPAEVTQAFDDTVRIAYVAVPANATGVSFTWTSADESIATVDQTGLITITGVGTTTVTVTGAAPGGSKSKGVAVVGTIKSIAITDEDGNISGILLPGSSTRLTATFVPADAEVMPEWRSSNPEVATVDQTGVATVISLGSATIYATVGDFVAEYALSTESPLSDAKGYWLFDDPSNLGKATAGGIDLIINEELVTSVPGPSGSNGAVRGSMVVSGDPDVAQITWEHQMTGQFEDNTKIWNYTIMMDVKVPYQDDMALAEGAGLRQIWNPVMSNDVGNRAGIYLLWVDYPPEQYPDSYGLGLAMNMTGAYQYLIRDDTYQTITPATLKGNEQWYRIIMSMSYAGDQVYRVYGFLDGRPNTTEGNGTYPAHDTSDGYCVPELEIKAGLPLYFMTNRKSDKRYQGYYDLAALAVWDRTLTDEEIATLGAIPR